MVAAASGFAAAAAALPIAANRLGAPSSAPTSWASRGPLSSGSGVATAGPARPLGRGRRNRPTGYEVLAAGTAGYREREADPAREWCQSPVRQPEVTVGLREHERHPGENPGEPDGACDVAAATEDRRRLEFGDD